MVQAGWFLDIPWWWVALWLPVLAFATPIGSGPKEHRP